MVVVGSYLTKAIIAEKLHKIASQAASWKALLYVLHDRFKLHQGQYVSFLGKSLYFTGMLVFGNTYTFQVPGLLNLSNR